MVFKTTHGYFLMKIYRMERFKSVSIFLILTQNANIYYRQISKFQLWRYIYVCTNLASFVIAWSVQFSTGLLY